MATRKNTIKLKRSNVKDNIPGSSQIEIGEVALNTADAKMYTPYTSGTTSIEEIKQIGWDRLSTESGGTVNGDVTIKTTLYTDVVSGDTQSTVYYGDGSNLTGIGDTYIDGTSFDSSSDTLTLSRNDNTDLTTTINDFNSLTADSISGGTISATTFYGDGSELSNISFSGLSDTDFTSLSDQEVAVYNNATGKWENRSVENSDYINAYSSNDQGTQLSSTVTYVGLNNTQYIDGNRYTLNNPDIEILVDGTYKIDYKLNTDNDSSNDRSTSYGDLFVDQGSGYNRVAGSRIHCYNRRASGGSNTGMGSVVLDLNAGDKIRLGAFQDTGNSSILADQSTVTISNHRGPVGPQGPAGSSATAAGNDHNIQFNDSGSFGGNDQLLFNNTYNALTLGYRTGAIGTQSIVTGGQSSSNNEATGNRSAIIGGHGHDTNTADSAIIGSQNSTITNSYSSALVGARNCLTDSGNYTFIGCARDSTMNGNGDYNTILNGTNHTIQDASTNNPDRSGIIGGDSNTVNAGSFSFILGGNANTLNEVGNSVILGGNNITASRDNRVYTPDLEATGQVTYPIREVTSNYTITSTSDDYTVVADASNGAITVTLPDINNIPKGTIYIVKKGDESSNTVTIATNGGNIDNSTSVIISIELGSYTIQASVETYYIISSGEP